MCSRAAGPAIVSTASTAMDAERIVIVGAGPAGLSTARSYREHGGRGSVALVGEEPLAPYERPPLTKEFLRGELAEEDLPIEREEWFKRHHVDLHLGVPVAAIEPVRGVVALGDGRRLEADAIVLATGSEPIRPRVPGAEHEDALTMRRLADSRAIAARAREGGEAIVIGSGFIGCEVAGSLAALGVPSTLVSEEGMPQEDRLGAEAAERIASWLRAAGVTLIGGASVSSIEDARAVVLDDGRRLQGSCVVLATGVRPRSELAERVGLDREDGAVAVASTMRSSDPAIFAVGDVALAHNSTAGRAIRVEHWGDALGHGKIAGATLAGSQAHWDEVPGFWSTIGDHTLKYAAWGDGYDESRLIEHDDGAFTVWYARDGATVGVLTHDRDEDYERGRERVAAGDPLP
jgi:3-phenylpropionate/trans-cinnamate dioxygenase ferredoxin reductase component